MWRTREKKEIELAENKSKNLLIWIVTCLAVYAAVVSTMYLIGNNNQKIGYVYSKEILKSHKGAVAADSVIALETKLQQEKIYTLQAELDSLSTIYLENENKWSAGRKKEFQALYIKKETHLKQYAQSAQQEINKKQQELLQPVYAEIDSVITEYANQHGYKIILGAIQGNIVYAEEAVNVTEEVIQFMNAGAKLVERVRAQVPNSRDRKRVKE